MEMSYNTSNMQYALERSKARRRRARMMVFGTIVALVVLVGAGVALGLVFSKKNNDSPKAKASSSSPSKSSPSPSPDGTSPDTDSSDPNDPSNFVKNPAFHKAFYGMAYTPTGSIMPDCGIVLSEVIKDIQIMSQLTRRVRLYGADCNQTAMVLEAVRQTKVDMEVFLGNFVVATEPGAYTRQRDAMKLAIQEYGVDHISGVTVGNEFMLNYLNGSTDLTSPLAQQGAQILIANIQDTRDMLASLDTGKVIPVGNSDAGSYFSPDVLAKVDYGLSNVHAWFAKTPASAGAAWVDTFFTETNVEPAALLPNKPKMYIAETGWPTASKDLEHATNGAAVASVEGLQTFLDTFVCDANTRGIPYFYFELLDEEWKDIQFGGVEGYWGLLDKNRNLKDIKIPTCTSP